MRLTSPSSPLTPGTPSSLGLAVTPCKLADYVGADAPDRTDNPLGVVRPATTDDVQRAVHWACKHKNPLAIFSSAPGARRRGITQPSPSLVVDLSAMRKVLKTDRQDAVAVIEAGVDFHQLTDALAPQGLRPFTPLRPRPGKSVLASYLEREPFIQWTAHWDIVDPLGSAEMVFGTGERFRCGTASLPGDLEDHWRQGVRYLTAAGPAGTDFLRVLQGAQGTLGIVTWAAVMCEPLPALERDVFVSSSTLEPLLSLSARLSHDRLGSAHFIANDIELAGLLSRDGGDIQALAANLPAWSLLVRLSAGHELPDQEMALALSDLQDMVKAADLQFTDALAGCEAGVAFNDPRSAVSHRDRWLGAHREVFFLSPLDRVSRWVSLAQEQAARGVGVYLQPRLQGRNMHVAFALPYRSGDPQDADEADSAARRLAESCCADGAFFSRPYGRWAPMAYARNVSIQPYLRKAKRLLDPARILNPGRLCY